MRSGFPSTVQFCNLLFSLCCLLSAGKEMIEMYFDFRLFRLWKSRQHSKLLDYDDLLWLRPPSVGLSAGYLTSEPAVRWRGVWLKGLPEAPRTALRQSWSSSAVGSFFSLLKRKGGPVDSASGVLFLPYPFSLSAYLSEKREREGQRKRRRHERLIILA